MKHFVCSTSATRHHGHVSDDSLAWGLGWGLAGHVFWHWGDMGFKDFPVAVASCAERRGLVCLTNSEHGLRACVDILRDVMGDDFSCPIAAVLERGW
ncbi:MAG: hypothetical protein WKF65_04215 [Gaiellaceae bacterium]